MAADSMALVIGFAIAIVLLIAFWKQVVAFCIAGAAAIFLYGLVEVISKVKS